MYVGIPTSQNFSDLFVLMNTSWVPFSRYFFNTIFITAVGTFGQIPTKIRKSTVMTLPNAERLTFFLRRAIINHLPY